MNFKDGVLLSLNVSKWSGAKKLEPSDLNLSTEEIPQFMKLGKKLLIPDHEKNVFTQIEQNARNYLEKYSFPFPVGQARFVPYNVLMRVVAELQNFQGQYQRATDSFIDRIEMIKREMLNTFPAYVDRLEPYYPNTYWLKRRFSFSWVVFEITDIDSSLKEIQGEEFIRAYEQFKQELEEKFNQFLNDAVIEMRFTVQETCSLLAERINRGDIVKAGSIKAIRSMIERFKELNFIGDRTVDQRLDELKALINHGENPSELAKELKDNDALREQLGTLARSIALEVAEIKDISSITGAYKRSLDLGE